MSRHTPTSRRSRWLRRGQFTASSATLPKVAQHFRRAPSRYRHRPRPMDRLPELVSFRDAPVAEPPISLSYSWHAKPRAASRWCLRGRSDEDTGGYPKHWSERFAQGYQVHAGLRFATASSAACSCALLRLSSHKDRSHEPEYRRLARALRALVRSAERATRPTTRSALEGLRSRCSALARIRKAAH